MFGGKKRIRIEFFDVETGQMIGFDEKKPKQIPHTFKFDTLVEIRGKVWKLVAADPFERKKFLKSGQLSIQLKLVEEPASANASEIPAQAQLFRTPSRPATLPDSIPKRKGKLLAMQSTEWRGIELISDRFRSAISREIGLIEEVRLNARTEHDGQSFYASQHTRNLPADVVELEGLGVNTLGKSWFPFANAYDGLAFSDKDVCASSTFAFGLPAGMALYGQTERGAIQCLGLYPSSEKHQLIAVQDIQRLVEFMDAHSLVMVDWDNLKFLEPVVSALSKYFDLETDPESESSPLAEKPATQSAPESIALAKADQTSNEAPEKQTEANPGITEDLTFTANPEPPSLTPPPMAKNADENHEFRIDHSLDEGPGLKSDEEE